MKKLIMFVMVLAIATPAVAELGEDADLNPPNWAGAPGTLYGYWDFTEALWSNQGEWRIAPGKEQLMVPHATNPDPEEFDDDPGGYMYQYWTGYGDGVWHEQHDGREGVLEVEMMSWDFNNFEGEGKKRMRLQLTWTGTQPEEVGWGYEDSGGEEVYAYGDWEDYVVTDEIPLDDGWTHTTLEYEMPENPSFEFVEILAEGTTCFIDQAVADTICYAGESPPAGPGRSGGVKKVLDIDDDAFPIYEPQDFGGPAPMGPTSANLKVKLAWQPGEDLGNPDFVCTIRIDPDPNDRTQYPNSDFSVDTSTEPNDLLWLTFTQDNWDTYQDIPLSAEGDELREGNEKHDIELRISIDIDDPNYGGPDTDPCNAVFQTHSITVVDNDIPYISVLPADPCKPLEGTLSENDPGVPVCVDVTLSHLPNSDVYVYVTRESEFELLLESMSVMDPPLGIADEPNRLEFTSGTYNSPQQICLEARDDEDRPDTDLEWIPGVILFNGISDDIRYQSSEDGGELEETEVDFDVQDNECGARGYSYADFNEDCAVDLADFAQFYSQWTLCTQPYPSDPCEVCDKLWNLEEEE